MDQHSPTSASRWFTLHHWRREGVIFVLSTTILDWCLGNCQYGLFLSFEKETLFVLMRQGKDEPVVLVHIVDNDYYHF